MAVILEAMSLGPSRGKRQHRVLAIERLDCGLLIDAEHRRVLRLMQIQPDDIGSFALKVWIVRGEVALQPMRAQPVLAPHPRHHHVTDADLGGKFARAPVGRPIARLALYTPLQDARLQRRSQRGRRLPGVAAKQPGQAFRRKPLAPSIDEAIGAIQLRADRGPGVTRIQQQDQSRSPRLIGASGLTVGLPGEFFVFHGQQLKRVAHEHDYTLISDVAVH